MNQKAKKKDRKDYFNWGKGDIKIEKPKKKPKKKGWREQVREILERRVT